MIRRTLKIKGVSDEWVFFHDLWKLVWGFAYLPISRLNEECPYDNCYDKIKSDTGQKLKGGME